MDKKIIDLQVKELSKEQYSKEQVLNELEHVLEHVSVKQIKVKSKKLDKTFKKLYYAYCKMLEEEGRPVICYDGKLNKWHLMEQRENNNYVFYPNRLAKYLQDGKFKSCRQKLKDKYDKFVSTTDLENLNDFQRGYYVCLQQLMVSFKYIQGHDVWKPKEIEE